MTELVIHPRTSAQLDSFAAAPSHALLMVGPAGSGKRSLAEQLADTVLAISSLSTYAYAKIIESSDGKAIGIEHIR